MHPLQREALLTGRDSIELTMTREHEIADFQWRDRELRPWVYEIADQRSGEQSGISVPCH